MKKMAVRADDYALRLTWREAARIAFGSVIFVGGIWLALFLLFAAGQA